MSRIKILLTDGSSPAALQAISALGRRYIIDVCDPRPASCPARYSRFVRRAFPCPSFGVSPISYAEFLVRRLKAEHYDVLLPTHDQTYLLARFRKELEALTRLPVPEFAAVEQIHDRVNFARLLGQLGLGHAEADVGMPPNTAQGVFQRGRLLAFHASQVHRASAGVVSRQAMYQPTVRDDLARLGAHLDWHGALTVQYAVEPTTGRSIYNTAHARLGETANAVANNVNLPDWLVQVALARGELSPMPEKRANSRCARTHDFLAGLRSRALDTGSRRQVLRELWRVVNEEDIYRKSSDERHGRGAGAFNLIPAAAAIFRLLQSPQSTNKPDDSHAEDYVLSEQTLQVIRKLSGKLL